MKTWLLVLVLLTPGTALPAQSLGPGGPCEMLSALTLPNATLTLAETVDAGTFSLPDAGTEDTFETLPSFCRVAATLTPSADSDIKMEVWMPQTGWNGKFQAVGNGGFAGSISYAALGTALARGYATASTDTGHVQSAEARWALGHPEKVTDFGFRAVHETTVAAKRLIDSYYGQMPRLSYWVGCSSGGRQGLKAAQRFPEDFDGIIAGAPASDWTGRSGGALRVAKVLEADERARLLETDRQLLHTAVLNACDAMDGVRDGLIEDPEECAFDPGILECRSSDAGACLSNPQVETTRLIYSDATNPASGRQITGLSRGSELGWTDLGWTGGARGNGLNHFRYLVHGDPNWNVQDFDFASDIVLAEERGNDTVNALDPNLKAFFDRGGKLIQYHGWNDPQISPRNSTQYYSRVLETLGGATSVTDSYRLFMVPGMAHCRGGEGPNTFDMLTALEEWVEEGRAPDRILAFHLTDGVVDRARPLCPYPQVAMYSGAGSTDEAASFMCTAR
jgi:feruloyl esterase